MELPRIVCSCSLPKPAKDMLAESWLPAPAEEVEDGGKPAPAFNPAAPEYNEMQRRLARCPVLQQCSELKARKAAVEQELAAGLKGAEKEAKASELDEVNEKLAAAEEKLAEIKGSFEADPLALVPWMQALFGLADAGMTAFDTGSFAGAGAGLEAAYTGPSCAGALAAAEKVLGTFKRRYELERGPGKVQVVATLAPNIFHAGFSPAVVMAELERARANILGPEAPEGLGLVLLNWLDYEAANVVPHLRALQQLAEDKVELSPDSGELAVTEPRKLAGLGLVNPPAAVIKEALRAGVKLAAVRLPLSVGDVTAAEVAALCRQHGIQVLATGALLEGLMSDVWLGVPCPGTITSALDPAAQLASVPAAQRLIEAYGGWDKLQALLAAVKAVADRRQVSMQAVALRWQLDQGAVPVLPMWWGQGGPWRALGKGHVPADEPPPAVVTKLLADGASFLVEEDLVQLSGVGRSLGVVA